MTPEPVRTENRRRNTGSAFAVLCSVQGLYCLITGVWPLVSIDTFQAVTGPKTDHHESERIQNELTEQSRQMNNSQSFM